jgi:hypothetical protein
MLAGDTYTKPLSGFPVKSIGLTQQNIDTDRLNRRDQLAARYEQTTAILEVP